MSSRLNVRVRWLPLDGMGPRRSRHYKQQAVPLELRTHRPQAIINICQGFPWNKWPTAKQTNDTRDARNQRSAAPFVASSAAHAFWHSVSFSFILPNISNISGWDRLRAREPGFELLNRETRGKAGEDNRWDGQKTNVLLFPTTRPLLVLLHQKPQLLILFFLSWVAVGLTQPPFSDVTTLVSYFFVLLGELFEV